jgi:hypothetical protein
VRPLDLADAGAIALCTGVVEMFEEGAEELEVLQALNILLGQRLSTRVGNAIGPVRAAARMAEKEPVAATRTLYS